MSPTVMNSLIPIIHRPTRVIGVLLLASQEKTGNFVR
jgi:hypothetical protein